jgi:hypothetical protein
MAQGLILDIYSILVSWTYILLIILVVAKIFMWMTGSRIFKGGGGDGGNGDAGKKKKSSDGSDNDDSDDKDNKNKKSKESLDVDKPGFVKVLVVDADDNPISGAQVRIVPARMIQRHWGIFKTKKDWRQYGGVTGPDGTWPSRDKYQPVGSGSVTISASKAGWITVQYQQTDYEIKEGEHYDIIISLSRKGEKAEQFEPKILSIEPDPSDPNKMIVKGVVKLAR